MGRTCTHGHRAQRKPVTLSIRPARLWRILNSREQNKHLALMGLLSSGTDTKEQIDSTLDGAEEKTGVG